MEQLVQTVRDLERQRLQETTQVPATECANARQGQTESHPWP
jgi:hypothetical protein